MTTWPGEVESVAGADQGRSGQWRSGEIEVGLECMPGSRRDVIYEEIPML